ncbi:hypothetical protein S83_011854, partial [Arachis hypogaea]
LGKVGIETPVHSLEQVRCKIYTLLFLTISFEWSSDTLPLSYQQAKGGGLAF